MPLEGIRIVRISDNSFPGGSLLTILVSKIWKSKSKTCFLSELLDEMQIRACNKYSKLDYKEMPTLFFEFHGTQENVEDHARRVGMFE